MAEKDDFTSVVDGDQLNQGFYNDIVNWTTVPALLNLVRMLQDRSVDLSVAKEDAWGEAYTSTTGRAASVSAISSNVCFDFTEKAFFVGDFSGSSSDCADVAASSNLENEGYVGIQNDSLVVKRVNTLRVDLVSATNSTIKVLEGATTSGEEIYSASISSGDLSSGINEFDVSDEGIVILPGETITLYFSASSRVYSSTAVPSGSLNDTTLVTVSGATNYLKYNTEAYAPITFVSDAGTSSSEGTITHTIPSDSFSSDISSAILTPLTADWESGASVDYKLTNSSDITEWSLAYAAYASNSVSVADKESLTSCITVADSGTKLYILGTNSDTVYQYTLSTPYDVSSATYVQGEAISEVTTPMSMFFKSDGSRLFILDSYSSDTVYSYTLSTPYDISSASYDSLSYVPSESSGNNSIALSSDGSKMYLASETSNFIYQYTLSTPYDVSSASYASKSFAITDEYGVFFKTDGTKMYLTDSGDGLVKQYSLSTAWDLSTATSDSVSIDVSTQTSVPKDICFSADGDHFYVLGGNVVYQYDTAGTFSGDDTGYLDANKITSFTSFTFEPTTLIVKLTQASSSPTLKCPSVKGVGVIAR